MLVTGISERGGRREKVAGEEGEDRREEGEDRMKGKREGGGKGEDRREEGGEGVRMAVQTCVPYLGLDYFGINFNASGSKRHCNSSL